MRRHSLPLIALAIALPSAVNAQDLSAGVAPPADAPPLDVQPVEPPPPPAKPEMPVHARKMLDAALASGNEGEVNTIVKYLRVAEPDHAAEIAGIANDWKAERREAATRRLRESSMWALVKGRIEVGGFMTSGNTENTGVHGVVDLRREGFRWRHRLMLQAEYQESFGVTTRERYVGSYEPQLKIDDKLFLFGNAQYEADRFAGYHSRYSGAAGAGITAIQRPGVQLALSLGPAFRHVDFTSGRTESNLAARGSIDFDWRLNPTITFNQDASAYLQDANSTVTSKTALTAKLIGPLQGQLSYQINYESMPPGTRVNTDTTSRASLIYTF